MLSLLSLIGKQSKRSLAGTNNGCRIECGIDGGCSGNDSENTVIECDSDCSECTFVCNGESSCSHTDMVCGEDQECSVECTKPGSWSSLDAVCSEGSIDAQKGRSLNVTAFGHFAFYRMNVLCPIAGGCDLGSGGYMALQAPRIDAAASSGLTLFANGSNAMWSSPARSAEIECPKARLCSLCVFGEHGVTTATISASNSSGLSLTVSGEAALDKTDILCQGNPNCILKAIADDGMDHEVVNTIRLYADKPSDVEFQCDGPRLDRFFRANDGVHLNDRLCSFDWSDHLEIHCDEMYHFRCIASSTSTCIPSPSKSPISNISNISNISTAAFSEIGVDLVSSGDSVCNRGEVALSLDVRADHIGYVRRCRWECWEDGLPSSDLRAALSDLTQCDLKLHGEHLMANSSLWCRACIDIGGVSRCSQRTEIHSLPVPEIDAFDIIQKDGNGVIRALDVESAFGVNITSTTFIEEETVFKLSDVSNGRVLASGNRKEMMAERITPILAAGTVALQICGIDSNDCSSCFTKTVTVNENPSFSDPDFCEFGVLMEFVSDFVDFNDDTNGKYAVSMLWLENMLKEDSSPNEMERECRERQLIWNWKKLQSLNRENKGKHEYFEQAVQSESEYIGSTVALSIILANASTPSVAIAAIRDDVAVLVEQVTTKQEAQSVLGLGNKLLSNLEELRNDDASDDQEGAADSLQLQLSDVCSVVDFIEETAEEMTNRIVADHSVPSELVVLNGDSIKSIGTRNQRNAGVLLKDGDSAFYVEIKADSDADPAEERQITSVFSMGEYAQLCMESKYGVLGGEGGTHYLFDKTWINITMKGSALQNGEVVTASIPSNFSMLSVCRESKVLIPWIPGIPPIEDMNLVAVIVGSLLSFIVYMSLDRILCSHSFKVWGRITMLVLISMAFALSLSTSLNFSECIDGGTSVLYLDEENGTYSERGIWMNEDGSFSSDHLTAFAVAQKMKSGDKHNKFGHFWLSTMALLSFLVFAGFVMKDVIGTCLLSKRKKEEKQKMPFMVKKLVLFILICNVLNEAVLIVYYAMPSDDVSAANDAFAFFIVLPTAFHFWAFSVAIFSWLKVLWSSSMMKSRESINKFKVGIIALNIGFSVIVFGTALSVATIDDADSVQYIISVFGAIMSVLVLLVSIAVMVSSRKLTDFIVRAARRVGLEENMGIIDKINRSGTMITACFVSYAFVTATSIGFEGFYLEYDVYLDAVIKASDFVSLCVIHYLYTERNSKQKDQQKADSVTTTGTVNASKWSSIRSARGRRRGSRGDRGRGRGTGRGRERGRGIRRDSRRSRGSGTKRGKVYSGLAVSDDIDIEIDIDVQRASPAVWSRGYDGNKRAESARALANDT